MKCKNCGLKTRPMQLFCCEDCGEEFFAAKVAEEDFDRSLEGRSNEDIFQMPGDYGV